MKPLFLSICLAVSGQLARAESVPVPAEPATPELKPVILMARPVPGKPEDGIIGLVPKEQTIQAVIDPRRPPYQIRIVGMKEGDLGYKVGRVEITRTGDHPRLIQTIRLDVDHSQHPYRDAEYFTVADINGDGYQDIQILIWYGATGNSGYDIWLYDPRTEVFVLSKDLDAYEWNHQPGQVRSHFHAGGGEQGWSISIFEDGRLVELCGEKITVPRDPHLSTLAGYLVEAKPDTGGKQVETPLLVFSRYNYDPKARKSVGQDYLDDGYGQGGEPDCKHLLRETIRKWNPEKKVFVETVREREDGEMHLVSQKTLPAESPKPPRK